MQGRCALQASAFLLFLLILAVSLACLPAASQAQEDAEDAKEEEKAEEPKKKEHPSDEEQSGKPAMSNLPLNFTGRHGLIFTSSTRVLEFKDVEPGVGYMYEMSEDPKFSTQTIAANLAVGLPKNFMLYGHVPIVITDLEWGERYNEINVLVRDFSKKEKTGLGSIEGGFQWAFFMQDRFLPGMAAGVTVLLPTGDYTQHMSMVKFYGVKVNLAMSLEVFDLFFTEYAFAVFADASLVLRDMLIEEREYEEKHGLIHAGMLFPLHPRNWISLMLEYDGVLMKGTTNRDDFNGFVMGLRFITNQYGLTAGAEYLFKEAEDMDDSMRFIATTSFRFW